MSGPYVQGPALLTECAAGSGVIVIVEGETYQDDYYIFTRWFGGRAREVSFFPQNGWKKVVAAVADLRAALPHRKVFGIVDRDFTPDQVLDQQARQCPGDGIFRMHQYTLENYLLEPAGWFAVVQLLYRAGPPAGWSTEAEVALKIEGFYRQLIRVGAYNHTIHEENDRQPVDSLSYREHPDAVMTAEQVLSSWGATRTPPQALDQVFLARVQVLTGRASADLSKWITGKAVLNLLAQALPRLKGKGGFPPDVLVNLYLDKCPRPPPEIELLVTRIVDRNGNP
jgi:hypothetical protein